MNKKEFKRELESEREIYSVREIIQEIEFERERELRVPKREFKRASLIEFDESK